MWAPMLAWCDLRECWLEEEQEQEEGVDSWCTRSVVVLIRAPENMAAISADFFSERIFCSDWPPPPLPVGW